MIKLKNKIFVAAFLALIGSAVNLPAQTSAAKSTSLNIGVINTRKCLEESKLSKNERATLEKMKSQMESVLKEKEKAVTEIDNKLRDEDYMDSVSDDMERELKHKKKVLMEEGLELNRQFTENLEMTNMKVMQGIIEAINVASAEVAKDMNAQNKTLDIILSNEATTFFNENLDLTSKIIAKMDELFEKAQAETDKSK